MSINTPTQKSLSTTSGAQSEHAEFGDGLIETFNQIAFGEVVADEQRENANVDANSAMGAMLKYGSESAKRFNVLRVLKPNHARAHTSGEIHIHDLDFLTLTMTCCQISLTDLFKTGFSTGHGVLRPPKAITSYASLACIAIQSNQNDQHGGQSVPNFDYDMAGGVKLTYESLYEKYFTDALSLLISHKYSGEVDSGKCAGGAVLNLHDPLHREADRSAKTAALRDTERATYQAMEAFLHNLNTMNSRAGAQTPFSSINYGTDTSPEGRMVIRNLLLATEAGLGRGETPIFPIQIFKVKEGVNLNPEDPNYDLFQLACKVSAQRLFPNFSFIDAPFNAQHYEVGRPETEVAYMGCRTRVMANIHDRDREITHGRGNLSFTSINLPRLAIEADSNVERFFTELDTKIDMVIDQLLHRMHIQGQRRVRNFPFLMGQGVWIDSEKMSADQSIAEVLKHGTLAVGFIGLAETLTALIGQHHGESTHAQELGLRIIGHMRNRVDEAAEKYRLNFSLIATPAEGLSGRFVRIDREKYGEIAGVTDKDYYTNSFHVPVRFPITAFAKIGLEAPYHALTNGGHISYIELDGAAVKNLEAFEAIVRAMHASGIGYGSINHPVDRDPECGYSGVIDDECPGCGRRESDGPGFDRIRRITGYLVGTLDRFNDAKRAEERERVRHGRSSSPRIS